MSEAASQKSVAASEMDSKPTKGHSVTDNPSLGRSSSGRGRGRKQPKTSNEQDEEISLLPGDTKDSGMICRI